MEDNKSFGNWEDPPPQFWEKFPNNPVFFSWGRTLVCSSPFEVSSKICVTKSYIFQRNVITTLKEEMERKRGRKSLSLFPTLSSVPHSLSISSFSLHFLAARLQGSSGLWHPDLVQSLNNQKVLIFIVNQPCRLGWQNIEITFFNFVCAIKTLSGSAWMELKIVDDKINELNWSES